jgi:DNA-binding beta-propeller fold protein YncE
VRTTGHNTDTPSTKKAGLSTSPRGILGFTGTRARKITPGLVALLVSLCALFIGVTTAGAAPTLVGTFGAFEHPTGVAVDEANGNVFVANGGEPGPEEVAVFNESGGAGGTPPAGGYPASLDPGSFVFGGELTVGVAIDNSASSPAKGAIYVTNVLGASQALDKFTLNGAKHYEEDTTAPFPLAATEAPVGAAVDAEGNVYMSDFGGRVVREYSSAGTELAKFSIAGVEHPQGIAVDANGDLFVQEYEGHKLYEVKRTSDTASSAQPAVKIAEKVTAIAIDRAANTLYVDFGTKVTAYRLASGTPVAGASFGEVTLGDSLGVAVNEATGKIYVSDAQNKNFDIYAPPVVQTRVFQRTFGSASTEPSNVVDPFPLSNPQGVAVNTDASSPSFGDVYVADTANNRIERLSATGEFQLMFGGDVGLLPGEDTCTISCKAGVSGHEPGEFEHAQFVAIDNAPGPDEGDVYVADTADNIVSKFSPEGVLETSWGAGGQLNGVNGTGKGTLSAGSTTVTAVTTEPGGTFTPGQEITATGIPGGTTIASVLSSTELEISQPATTAGVGVSLAATKPFGEIAGIAVGPTTGTLYVMKAGGPSPVFEFEQDSKFKSEIVLENGFRSLGLVVNGEGDFFKVYGAGGVREYGEAGGAELRTLTSPGFEVPAQGALTSGPEGGIYVTDSTGAFDHYAFNVGEVVEPGGGLCAAQCEPSDSVAVGFIGSGIGVATDGDTFLANPDGKVYQYEPLVTLPSVEEATEEATEVEPFSARLNGQVNPAGLPVTECVFEYGETTGYSQQAPCEHPDAAEIGSGPVAVHADIKGLTPGVTYHFRLNARNASDPGPKPVPDPGSDAHFETLPKPAIESATVTALTASTATLNAQIDPGRSTTHYHFEYDTTPYTSGAPHGVRIPACEVGVLGVTKCEEKDPSIPAGEVDVLVPPQNITGLSPNTQYYWRVVATNGSGTTTGLQQKFIYQLTEGAGAGGLPDGRAYEMVTPSHKNGSLIGDTAAQGVATEVAASGEHVMASAIQCFAGAGSCEVQHLGSVASPYEFTRSGESGLCAPAAPPCWHTTPLSPPASELPMSAQMAFSAEAGTALFSIPTGPALGGEGENDLYVREPTGKFVNVGPETPPEDGAQGPRGGGHAYTADFSHYAWDAGYLWSSPFVGNNGTSEVYEYAPGVANRHLNVGVSGGYEAGKNDNLISACGTKLGPINGAAPGSMSVDGRTVFFTALPKVASASGSVPCPSGADGEVPVSEVYARVDGESAEAHTVAISEPQALEPGHRAECKSSGCITNTARPANPATEVNEDWRSAGFIGASEDGSRAFFTSTQQLTDGATEDSDSSDNASRENGCSKTEGADGCNLYEYEGVTGGHPSLVDLSEGAGGAPVPGGPRVQGVMALSSDGSHVYFVAQGVLTSEERPGCIAEWNAAGRGAEAVCQAVEGQDNLYVYDTATARTAFVTIMAASEGAQWEEANSPANVTPDGRFMVFPGHGDLTADDTSRSGAAQVFRYDAQTGALNRVSIGNEGFDDDGNRSAPTPCYINDECAEDAHIAQVPVQARLEAGGRSDPTMSDDGSRVFFESPVGLTPHALDDVQIATEESNAHEVERIYARNVYEWEQAGVGSCPVAQSAGCTYLISDGRDTSVNSGNAVQCVTNQQGGNLASAVCLLGTDTTGDDVFFTTDDQLVGSDTNTELDYYDARVCGGEDGPCVASSSPAAGCSGEECHGIPAAQLSAPSGGTLTFNGAGNATSPGSVKPKSLTRAQELANALKVCKKDKKKSKRQTCEKQARKKYGPTKKKAKTKKASHNGRTK